MHRIAFGICLLPNPISPEGDSCSLFWGPTHKQQRTALEDREVLLVSQEEGTNLAPSPQSGAGSLLRLLDAMHSSQKTGMTSFSERFEESSISSPRINSRS